MKEKLLCAQQLIFKTTPMVPDREKLSNAQFCGFIKPLFFIFPTTEIPLIDLFGHRYRVVSFLILPFDKDDHGDFRIRIRSKGNEPTMRILAGPERPATRRCAASSARNGRTSAR